jgi:hypothetical protein
MAYASRHRWNRHNARLRECFDRIDAAVGTFGNESGGSADHHPYRFRRELLYFDAVKVIVNFEHEDDEHLRYLVRIEEHTIAHRALAIGPTGLIDVRNGLDTALGDIDAAFDKIIAFLDSSMKIIRHADPPRPPGLSDIIAEFGRFISS